MSIYQQNCGFIMNNLGFYQNLNKNTNQSHQNYQYNQCPINNQPHINLNIQAKSFQPKFSEDFTVPNNNQNESSFEQSSEEEKTISTLDSSSLSVKSKQTHGQGNSELKYKTEKCKYWEINKCCKYKDNCAFAHGNNEMRQKNIPTNNYKTKKCKQFFEIGYCPYGPRCQFLHNCSSSSIYFSYKKAILALIDDKNANFEEKKSVRPRLKIFEAFTKAKSEMNHEELLNEISKLRIIYTQ